MASDATTITVAGREVRLSSPKKVVYPARADRADGRGPERAITKHDLVEYYLAVAEVAGPGAGSGEPLATPGGALAGVRDRPGLLKRFPKGIDAAPFFQKRIPATAPEWLETAEVTFPSGRTARELVIQDAAHLVWAVQMNVVDLNPWPVRRPELDRPDELRVDLDPEPGVEWDAVRRTALVVRDVLHEHGLVGWPKTSGSRGIHVTVPIRPEWTFDEVRRAGIALARAVERRAPDLATTSWWKEERHGVFLDYNQNARDRTVAAAFSVRPTPLATVSMPVRWEDVPAVEMGDFRVDTVPGIVAAHGDPHAGMHDTPGSLDALLALSREDEEQRGLGDAPWPPHYAKRAGEPPRVAPSRAAKPGPTDGRAETTAESVDPA